MSTRNVATIISRVCEPMVLLTGTAIIGGAHAGLSPNDFSRYIIFLLLFMVAPVLGLWIWFVKTEKMSWDIPDRAKRVRPLLLVLGLVVLDYIFTTKLHTVALTQLFLFFIIWLIGFTVITTKWKISGHAGVAALASGFYLLWYGAAWWPVLLVVPVVGWARVVRRDHTVAQVIAGVLYSWVVMFLSIFFLFGKR